MLDSRQFFKTQDGNYLQFNWETSQNNFQTRAQGRPIFDTVLIMSVLSSGQQKSTFTKEVVRRFADGETPERRDEKAFAMYGDLISKFLDDEGSQELGGTPIEHWKEIDMAYAATLRALNIFTVEDMANLSDAGLTQVGMGARDLQRKAKEYIENSKDSAKLKNAYEELQEENRLLEAQVASLTATVKGLEAKETHTPEVPGETAPKKRGRKKRKA